MARPRNKIFYEHAPLESVPPGQEWTILFDANSRKVVEYLKEKGAGSTVYHGSIRCLEAFRNHLVNAGINYSPEAAEDWYRNTGPYPKGFLSTLYRLRDVYETGEIRPLHAFPTALPYYAALQESLKDQLDLYLDSIKVNYAPSQLNAIRNRIARFLYSVQSSGMSCPEDITFDFLESYLSNDAHASVHSRNTYAYSISDFLIYMADSGRCTYGIAWYAYAHTQWKTYPLSELSGAQILKAESLRQESREFPAEEFAALIPDFLQRLEEIGYSKNHRSVAHYTLYSLLVFLDMNGFGYHPEIANIWLELETARSECSGWKAKRRFLDLFDEYTHEGDIPASKVFRKKPLKSDLLPEWCKETLDKYLHQKKKEGWKNSTMAMIRSSVTRFCEFLAAKGLDSFSGITPELISEFNRTDEHLTAEGKNAYNRKIRKFIRYLEQQKILPFGTGNALLCSAETVEKNVVILSAEEESDISLKVSKAERPIEYRNAAVMLLGKEMGIRSIDIVGINLEDIDWDCQVIRILQKKTSHEIDLPMPVSVGNALYRYLKYGRPKTDSHALIISTKIPYQRASRAACGAALHAMLPDRHVPGSGFHVTRKTFATKQLRQGVGMNSVTEMLGHKDKSSLFRYLNLDSEKMRQCPFSLKEAGLEMEGSRYD